MAESRVRTFDNTIGERFCCSLRVIPRDGYFRLSKLEKNPKAQMLLSAKLEHQIAFARRFVGESS